MAVQHQNPDGRRQRPTHPRVASAAPAFDEVLSCGSCDSRSNYVPTIRTEVYEDRGDFAPKHGGLRKVALHVWISRKLHSIILLSFLRPIRTLCSNQNIVELNLRPQKPKIPSRIRGDKHMPGWPFGRLKTLKGTSQRVHRRRQKEFCQGAPFPETVVA